eukprot:TRINITY_DN8439_c0_g1_i1.p1 TRINITY_DN8439_c0_g1~~TRINITY_DN8439_c0_g1_i1.p1  ORF type:complete len:396 (+),score=74.22 TRINITY_DN8439_c0_g1_i1:40-1188(+)
MNLFFLITLSISLISIQIVLATNDWDGIVKQTDDGRYTTLLHPAFKESHASFLEVLPNGDLLCAWFSGMHEGYSGVAIVMSRLVYGSSQWSDFEVLSQREGYSNQNPVIYYDPSRNQVQLYHSQQPASENGDETMAHIWRLVSEDNGYSWSKPELAFDHEGIFCKNRMVLIGNPLDREISGGLMLPTYNTAAKLVKHNSSVSRSFDSGKTWTTTDIAGSSHMVQPSIVRSADNSTLIAFFRDRKHEKVYMAKSNNEGKSWTKPKGTRIPNSDSAIQAVTLRSGSIAMVFNNCTKGREWLVVAISDDDGATWPYQRSLEPEDWESYEASKRKRLQFSYPSVVQDEKERIHISYSYKGMTIKYVRVDEGWIRMGDPEGAPHPIC